MVTCPGGPILEIPAEGRFVFERLSPGTIREEDYYEEFRLVPGGRPGSRILVACPRGSTRKGVCTVGQRVLRIWHDKRFVQDLIRRCKRGELAQDRSAAMRRILDDIDRLRRGLKVRRAGSRKEGLGDGGGLVAPQAAATTPLGRLGQFILTTGVSAMFTVLIFKFFFPGVFTPVEGPAAASAAWQNIRGSEEDR